MKRSEVEKMLAEVDADGSGEVNYTIFFKLNMDFCCDYAVVFKHDSIRTQSHESTVCVNVG